MLSKLPTSWKTSLRELIQGKCIVSRCSRTLQKEEIEEQGHTQVEEPREERDAQSR